MRPILIQLEQLNKDESRLKEELFDWITELSQADFDQLCSEIIALDHFFKKYNGAIVTDAPQLVRHFKSVLHKVELVIELDERHFDRIYFYRWLGDVAETTLQQMCFDLEDAYDQAIETLNTYDVSRIFQGLADKQSCWYIKRPESSYLSMVSAALESWKTPILLAKRISA